MMVKGNDMGKTLRIRDVLLLSLAIGSLALSGCSMTKEELQRQTESASRRDALLRESVARVRIEDGVDETEAQQIARLYWQKFSPTQGALGRISDQGTRWEVTFFEINTSLPARPILIDKSTGGVTWSIGPAIRSIQELLAR